MSVPFAPVAW